MNKWQKNLLQDDDHEPPLRVWEVLLYWAIFLVVVTLALSSL